MSYAALAPHYDRFTQNVDYAGRAAYFQRLLAAFRPQSRLVLDLGCGTGSLSVELAKLGYDVIGVDRSAQMLSIATNKSAGCTPPVLYLCQDMTRLDLYGTIDAAICALDTVNHLVDPKKLAKAFGRVSLFLEPDGVFIFDVNTPYKHSQVLGENVFVYEGEGAMCVWQNHQNGPLAESTLDIFECQGDNLYTRKTDEITERAYSRQELLQLAQGAGLELLAVYEDGTTQPPSPQTEREVYILKKVGK